MSKSGNVVEIRCLGDVRAIVAGTSVSLTPDQQLTLAVLVAAGPDGLNREQLAGQLFPDVDVAQAGQAAIMRARRLADKLSSDAAAVLETRSDKVCIRSDQVSVDTWDLVAGIEQGDPDKTRELLLGWSEPFAGLRQLSESMELEAEYLRRRFVTALIELLPQVGPSFGGDVIPIGTRMLEQDPYNEELAVATAIALYRNRQQRAALEVLRTCRRRLHDDCGLSPTPELARVELALLNHDREGIGRLDRSDRKADASQRSTTNRQDGHRSTSDQWMALDDFVGREDLLDKLNDRFDAIGQSKSRSRAVPIVIEGPGGTGKSSVVGQFLVRHVDSNVEVRIGQTNAAELGALQQVSGTGNVYAAILEALPELESHIELLLEGDDHDQGRMRFWEQCQKELGDLTKRGPAILVLEDLHDADSQTCGLFRYLASGNRPANLMLVATARPATESRRDWHRLLDELETDNVVELVDLPPLSLPQLEEMVGSLHPHAPPALRQRFAYRLHQLSQGNAKVASVLNHDADNSLDPSMLPAGINPETGYANHLDNKVRGHQLVEMLSVASLIAGTGLHFEVRLLVESLGADEEAVRAQLDEGRKASVCIEVNDDLWRFDHQMTVGHFSSKLDLLRPMIYARLARLAPRSSPNIVRFVRGAGEQLERSKAIEILDSAAAELESRLAFAEAVGALEHLLILVDDRPNSAMTEPDTPVGPHASRRLDVLLRLAACSGRVGNPDRAAHYRRSAFEVAEILGDVDGMFAAATAGLPEGEYVGGGSDRHQMLLATDPSRLTSVPAAQYWYWRLRLARLSDDPDAVEAAIRSSPSDMAQQDPEGWKIMAFELLAHERMGLAARTAFSALTKLVDAEQSPSFRTYLLQGALVAGLTEQQSGIVDLYHRAVLEAEAHGSPRVKWGVAVLGASLNQVGVETISTTYEQARLLGLELGIPDVYDAWMVQVWADFWFADRLDDALAMLDARREEIADNVAWESAAALAAATAGATTRARAGAQEVASRLTSNPAGVWARPAACLLTETASLLGDSSLADIGVEILRQASGQSMILGVGSAHMGPIDRYLGLAMAHTSPAESRRLLTSALDQATQGGLTVWQDRIQLDMNRLGLQS